MSDQTGPETDPQEGPGSGEREQLLTAHEAAELLGLDVDELARLRAQGAGPEWGELTRRHIRYDRREVEAYLARRRAGQPPGQETADETADETGEQ